MEVKIRSLTENKEILNACRTTVWKDGLEVEPSENFMHKLYASEHSPLRDKWFVVEIFGIKSWIATHLSRHSVGVTPYISTNREDRTEYEGDRDSQPQGKLVNMRLTLNAQAFINISKVRLCTQSHAQTRAVWREVINQLNTVDPILVQYCVPTCVYRGLCPEGKDNCYIHSTAGKRHRENYKIKITGGNK